MHPRNTANTDPPTHSTSKPPNNKPLPLPLPTTSRTPLHQSSNLTPSLIPNPIPIPTLKAVIIRCPSTAYPVPFNRIYAPITISPLELQFHANDPPLPIPSLVGLPLWIRSHSWVGSSGMELKPLSESMIENVYARSLCVSADVESVRFGAVGAVVGDMGSVVRGDKVVARKDGKDLWCQHLVCLGAFCEAVVEEFLRREKEREMTRRAGRKKDEERGVRFRRLACREEFEMFWERWCRGRLGTRGEGECGRMKGPYDM